MVLLFRNYAVFGLSSCLVVITNVVFCSFSEDIKLPGFVIRTFCIFTGIFEYIFDVLLLS